MVHVLSQCHSEYCILCDMRLKKELIFKIPDMQHNSYVMLLWYEKPQAFEKPMTVSWCKIIES